MTMADLIDDDSAAFFRDCGPVLDEMRQRLGSWEAVGAQIGYDLKHRDDDLDRIKLTPRAKKP